MVVVGSVEGQQIGEVGFSSVVPSEKHGVWFLILLVPFNSRAIYGGLRRKILGHEVQWWMLDRLRGELYVLSFIVPALYLYRTIQCCSMLVALDHIKTQDKV